ncbi:PilZ domain-containing protein [Rhizorhabdus dicambivorans]|nr:PilZ domain-containing protein [Rhizorhabdus dicambivorans]
MYQSFHSEAFQAPVRTAHLPLARREERHAVAMPARLRPDLKLTLDAAAGGADQISDVIVTDISHRGLSAVSDQVLIAGTRVMVDMPVIGRREAEIRWISDNRAGCRFVEPLDEEELHAALCGDSRMARCFPGLMSPVTPDQWGRA